MGLLAALDGSFADSRDAVSVDGASTSWEGLAQRADVLAAEIAGAAAVAVDATPSLDTVIAVVAALRAGVPAVPIPADAGPMERAHMLADSGASLVLGAPDWPEVELSRVPVPRSSRSSGPGVVEAANEVVTDAPALVIYTSGTTGRPKGAVLSQRALAAGLDGLADAWAWTPDDVVVHGLPLFHVHGLVLGMLGPLRIGSRVHHTGRPTPEAYAAAVRDSGGTMLFGVPTVWSRIAANQSCAAALAGARLLVSGSAALPTAVFDRLRELTGHEPIERYGMTETMITLSTRADGERRPGHVGVPIRGVETRLRSDEGARVAHDGSTIGGLQVRGDTLFDGYLNLPERTAEAFTDDDWFVTGDAVAIDAGGFHRIVGRASIDIIKTGGFKVGAGEVETALLTHPGIVEAAVIGLPDDDLGERIVAFVVGDIADEGNRIDVIDHVAGLLSVHKRPREVRVVDQLPRNAMGKVQKQQLRP